MTERGRRPNFIHAGVPKSASATINAILRSHPEIFLPRQKEPNFFNDDKKFRQGLSWYTNTYFSQARNEAIVGDMSIGYATGFGFDAPERIRATIGTDLRIFFTFRDPVARAYSQYKMARYKGQLERLEFGDAIRRALNVGPHVTEADRVRVRTGTYYSNARDMDIFRYCSYVELGHYGDILDTWSDVFGKERILVLLTHDIARELQAQANRLFEFLGVEPQTVRPDIRQNEAATLRYPGLRRGLNRIYSIGVLRAWLNHPSSAGMRKWLRRRFLSWNYVPNAAGVAPEPEAVKILRAHYAPQVVRLEGFLGRELDGWRSG